jgi:hypothetical protein
MADPALEALNATRDEYRRRFRQMFIGYLILAVLTLAAVIVTYNQERTINSHADAIGTLAICDAPKPVRTALGVNAPRCTKVLLTYKRYVLR